MTVLKNIFPAHGSLPFSHEANPLERHWTRL